MSTNHTQHYDLCQWQENDKVLRTDFNEDNAKIDAALAEMPKIVAGTYTGDNAETRIIELGFTPKIVYLCNNQGLTYYNAGSSPSQEGGLAMPGAPMVISGYECLTIVDGGFQVAHKVIGDNRPSYAATNSLGISYRYFAVG